MKSNNAIYNAIIFGDVPGPETAKVEILLHLAKW
jgi:hypothetical protein